MSKANRLLLIDNYDSFTFNLLHYLVKAGQTVHVVRNDHPKLLSMATDYDAIVISPGPSSPANSGFSKVAVAQFYQKKPILGVCLGMQVINEVFGGSTIRAPYPVHGKTSNIRLITDSVIFKELDCVQTVGRYHSLICGNIPPALELTAMGDCVPMAFQHREYPVFGLQFHPESFLTENGFQMIGNFINILICR